MKISEAAKSVGLPTKTVRYYADIGLVTPASRTDAGYREYDEDSIRKLCFVKRARKFGFSVKDCRDLLDLYQDSSRSAAMFVQLPEIISKISKPSSANFSCCTTNLVYW